mmetsp:Transcript_117656/g.234421  ORF Transcript_117656/g.234421 Transcript_117656/m.234421 type:complete len:102 (-) Transcript_117656:972-1277(-)
MPVALSLPKMPSLHVHANMMLMLHDRLVGFSMHISCGNLRLDRHSLPFCNQTLLQQALLAVLCLCFLPAPLFPRAACMAKMASSAVCTARISVNKGTRLAA